MRTHCRLVAAKAAAGNDATSVANRATQRTMRLPIAAANDFFAREALHAQVAHEAIDHRHRNRSDSADGAAKRTAEFARDQAVRADLLEQTARFAKDKRYILSDRPRRTGVDCRYS